ncbi:MAG: hypothetical protein OEL77_08085 [Nitrosopumilus sp.]|nr:hypothetical protein [Nitrosopumilus sp.]
MKNSIKFTIAVIFTVSLLSGTTSFSYASNHIPSPREQIESGISPANIVCKEGLKLVIRANTNSAACVMNSSYDRILQTGWAKTLEDYKSKPQLSNIGDVKTIRAVPLYFDAGIRESKPEIITTYNYVFEACAGSKTIATPQILIISDSETKFVNLSQKIPALSCKLGTTEIKAAAFDSINANLVKKTDLAIISDQLQSKMKSIQEKLVIEKKELANLVDQDSHSKDDYKKISEKTKNIVTLKESLDVARAEWQKNQYVLIVSAKEPPAIKPQLSNKELPSKEIEQKNYPHINKIKISPEFVDSGRLKSDPITSSYKFIFEACSGESDILFPESLVRSDSEAKSIKIADSLEANSCQTSSTSIRAADKNSIQATIITDGHIPKLLTELGSKVLIIQEDIVKNKKDLVEITNQSPAPDNFEQKISEITNKIVNLKDELNQAKEEFNIIKYMTHE